MPNYNITVTNVSFLIVIPKLWRSLGGGILRGYTIF